MQETMETVYMVIFYSWWPVAVFVYLVHRLVEKNKDILISKAARLRTCVSNNIRILVSKSHYLSIMVGLTQNYINDRRYK